MPRALYTRVQPDQDALIFPPMVGAPATLIAPGPDPAVVRAILAHLGLSPGPDSPGPAPPQLDPTAAPGSPSPRGPAGLSEVSPIADGHGRQGRRLPPSRGP